MNRRPAPASRWRPPPNLPPRYPVVIQEIQRVTPRVTRLTLHSPELAGFTPAPPGRHIKLILPAPGQAESPPPVGYEGRRPVFAEGVTPPVMRTYTPLRFDARRLELEVEILDHGDSPAANWLRGARPGQRIVVAGPRGGWQPPDDGDAYLVAADDTAIPAATQVIRELPGRPGAVVFEVEDAAERRSLPGIADDLPQWRFRQPPGLAAGAALEATLREFPFPAGRVYVWIALESGVMRRIRRHLIETVGRPADRMVTRGHRKQGAGNYRDGDYGRD